MKRVKTDPSKLLRSQQHEVIASDFARLESDTTAAEESGAQESTLLPLKA